MSRLRELLRLHPLANHYPALHGLRVLAIVSVVQLHVTVNYLRRELIRVDGFWGVSFGLWFGMDVFFFLSGFLIGSMLLAGADDRKPLAYSRFYLRRALRIIPPYVVTLTVLAIATPLSKEQAEHLVWEYAYLTNYVPPVDSLVVMPWAWSLAMEEHFYLLVPALIAGLRLLPRVRTRLVVLAALWLSASVVRAVVFLRPGAPAWDELAMLKTFYVQSHLRYDILVAGVACALVEGAYGPKIGALLERWPWRVAFLATFALGMVALYEGVPLQHELPAYNLVCWGPLTSVTYAPIVLYLIHRKQGFARALGHPMWLPIATLGYGIYLVHVPVIDRFVVPLVLAAFGHDRPFSLATWLVTLVASLVASAALAWVIHVAVERPVLALRERWTS